MSERMSILYVSPFAHRIGHHASAVIRESAALQRAGGEVTVVTFSGVRDELPKGVHEVRVTRKHLQEKGTIKLLRLLNVVKETIEQLLVCLKVAQCWKRGRFNVIFYRDPIMVPFIPFIASLVLKGSVMVISLGAWPEKSQMNRVSRVIKYSRLLNSFYKWLNRYNRFVFVGFDQYTTTNFGAYFRENIIDDGSLIKYIPVAIDPKSMQISKKLARELIGIPLNKKVLLLFGAVHEGKDVETVVRALKGMDDICLLVVGKFVVSRRHLWLQRFIQINKMANVIVRNEYISEKERQFYCHAADAFVIAMKQHFLWSASMVLEAAKSQTPVIASDSGELGDVVRQFNIGVTFFCEDVASLRQAINKFFMMESSEIEKMKMNGKKCVEEFSIDRWARKHMGLYQSLCKEK